VLDDLLRADGLAAVAVKEHIGSKLVYDARSCGNSGGGLCRLEASPSVAKLQEGLAKLQAEGVLEGGVKAANAATRRSAVQSSDGSTVASFQLPTSRPPRPAPTTS
jgi:hypothetical protein